MSRHTGLVPAAASRRARVPVRYAEALAAVAAATGLSWVLSPLFGPSDAAMTYFLAVVVIAARHGRAPSVFTAVAGVAAFDFFFVPPPLTFAVADTQYLLTFAVMLTVGLVIGGLTAQVRQQAEAARHREDRAAALYAMSGEFARTESVTDLVAIAVRHIGAVFAADVVVSLAGPDDALARCRGVGDVPLDDADVALARQAWEDRRPTGLGTPSARSARALHVPLLGHGPLGVVTVVPRRRDAFAAPEAQRQLETFVNQMALAVERARVAEEAEATRLRAETERLRNALLMSVSHDLRTPLAAIMGAATTVLESGPRLAEATRDELMESIRDEASRLNRLVQNLLQMTRLESGALQLRREWHSLEEVVGAALARVGRPLADRQVAVSIPPDLPLVAMDDVLIEQVLVNLLDNAVTYTPAGTPIRIVASASNGRVTVEVADCGPGLPPADRGRVFDKFYRGAEPPRHTGAGLGLAICRGIVEAHGGRIWAHNGPGRGASFLFALSLGDAPSVAVADA